MNEINYEKRIKKILWKFLTKNLEKELDIIFNDDINDLVSGFMGFLLNFKKLDKNQLVELNSLINDFKEKK